MKTLSMGETEKEFISMVYIKYSRGIYFYICHLFGHSTDAEDILSEVFLVACEKSGALMAHPNPAGFLYATAKNKVTEHRRNICRKKLLMERMQHTASKNKEELLAAEDTEYALSAAERAKGILNKKEYNVFVDRYILKLTAGEIAKKEGISLSLVYTRISRLKSKINSFMELQ